jgi:hypothetical protein
MKYYCWDMTEYDKAQHTPLHHGFGYTAALIMSPNINTYVSRRFYFYVIF